ncbi:MAG: hypothetical protein ACK5LP_08810 [Campylobacteraceae bacterium]
MRHFQEYFKDLDNFYVVVVGFATLMLLDSEFENHGKATFDIDLVLLTSNSLEMTQRVKRYMKEGKYTVQIGEKERFKYYRFTKPQKDGFAKEIELVALNENHLELDDMQRIIPIDAEEGLYSLSAIILDVEYFEMIKNNIEKKLIAPCTNTQATIMLKISAFYDLKNRGDEKYKKHRRDILKLSLLLTGDEEIKLVGRMQQDFDAFIHHIEDEVDNKMLKSIVSEFFIEKEEVIEVLQKVFKR